MPENTDTLLMNSVNEGKMEDESTLPLEGNSHRPRKKHIYEQILKLLEFYMGDANLSKDRFLAQELKKSPQLPVDLFLSFNKIRSITNDARDLVIALKKSTLLELTDDLQKVFRKKEVKPRANLDECTLYVENLPCEANHDWLTKIFRNYGNVTYVSIPKFRVSRYNKGFAFIEFDSPECVTKVLEAFGAAGCRLSADMPSDQLLSIKTFEDDAAKSLYPQGQWSDDRGPEESESKNKSLSKEESLSDGLKCTEPRKPGLQGDSEESGKEEIGASSTASTVKEKIGTSSTDLKTDRKQEVTDANDAVETVNEAAPGDDFSSVQLSTVNRETAAKEAETAAQADTMDTVASDSSEETEDDKNLRPRNRKNKKAKKKNKLEVSSLGLQVLSKLEWKRLRNKYLNLQRVRMAELKRQVRALAFEESTKMVRAQEELQRNSRKRKHDLTPSVVLKNKPEDSVDELQRNSKKPKYNFTPGVILKIEPEDLIEDIKQFRLDTKSKHGVVYVDIVPERKDVYVRCETAEAARELLSASTWPNCSLLQGEEEKHYWAKIEEDRAAKQGKERKKERGRTKLLHRIKKFEVVQEPLEVDEFRSGKRRHWLCSNSEEESPAVEPSQAV